MSGSGHLSAGRSHDGERQGTNQHASTEGKSEAPKREHAFYCWVVYVDFRMFWCRIHGTRVEALICEQASFWSPESKSRSTARSSTQQRPRRKCSVAGVSAASFPCATRIGVERPLPARCRRSQGAPGRLRKQLVDWRA